MIPKIIHYVWFGSDYYPPDVVKCISSWKEKMPDYEVKLWNARNFDLSLCAYAKEAYDERKFAFASDYVRLWALYTYGGIYLDSDVEVLQPFDDLLNNRAFTGFETESRIAACIFGSEKGNPLFKEFMDDYEGRRFVLGQGQYDLTPNPVFITKRLKKHGLRADGRYQELDYITIYPMDYFCPFNPYRKSGDCFSETTYANHHFNGIWKKSKTKNEKKYAEREMKYKKYLGVKVGSIICKYKTQIEYLGFCQWLKKQIRKMQEYGENKK